MEKEKRLIDANALKKKAKMQGHCIRPLVTAFHLCVSVHDIDEAPTVDAVEVVRCCDCLHCIPWQQYADAEVILYCKKKRPAVVDPTDFCSYGERRADNDDNS